MKSWMDFRKYLRERKVGDFVTRGDILRSGCNELEISYNHTMDTYINDLINAGVLERHSRGVYTIEKRLKPKTTISSIRRYNSGDWKPWFLDELFE